MVVWDRMENLPRSGMPPVTAEVALGEVSCDPGVFLTYITCISPLVNRLNLSNAGPTTGAATKVCVDRDVKRMRGRRRW